MMRSKKIWGVFLMVWLMSAVQVWAQGNRQQDGHYHNFVRIKREIMSLMEKNSTLKTQYLSLQNKLSALQELLRQRQEEIADIRAQIEEKQRAQREEKQQYEYLQEQLQKAQSELASVKTRRETLLERLKDMEKERDRNQLELKGLIYQEREHLTAKRLKNLQQGANSVKDEKEETVEALEKTWRRYQKKEEELIKFIQRIERRENELLEKMDSLYYENEVLEKKIKWTRQEIDFQRRENANLVNKRVLLDRSLGQEVVQQKAEKRMLQRDVGMLELEYQSLEKQVELSILRQEHRRKLLRDIMRLDKENQELRRTVKNLETQIRMLEEE